MKKNNQLLKVIFTIFISGIFLISYQKNSFAETTDEAIKLYQDAEFGRAKDAFEKLTKQKSDIKKRQIAFAYLALIEMASRNGAGANEHLFKLLLLDPSFDLKQIRDITPDIEKRFHQIKSENIIQGVLYYQNAEFGKAKDIFENLLRQGNQNEKLQIALAYLALIEMASRNEAGTDSYLSKLISMNPDFELKNISDMTPDFEERFKQIKKSDGKILPIKDTVRPSGEIRGIKNSYTVGETISYKVIGNDNNALKKMIFKIKENLSVAKEWNAIGKSSDYTSSFATDGWKPGTYHYIFVVEDNADNSKEYKGNFTLTEAADATRPTVEVTGIRKTYVIGEIISYTVTGNDDRYLIKMSFEIKDSSVKKTWNVNDPSATYTSSFSTSSWKAGTYDYTFSVEDSAGNTNQYRDSFVLTEKLDNTDPTGEISGIGKDYTQGDLIRYSVRAEDNKSLRKMTFRIKNNPSATKEWKVKDSVASQESSFSTEKWKPGTYDYAFLVEDDSGNSKEYTGSFVLAEKVWKSDTIKPTGKITKISNNYTEGDNVYYAIQAQDNESLSKMTFDVKNASVKKSWNISGTSASQESSFSTKDWKPGIYDYVFLVEDDSGNSEEYAGSFVLAEKVRKSDTNKPTGKITKISNNYTEGDNVYYTIQAQDDKSLSKMTFGVRNTSVKKSWNISGQSASQESSFSTKDWKPGIYDYAFLVEDDSGNSEEYAGSFVLAEKVRKSDTNKPTGKITKISNNYTEGDNVYYTIQASDDKSLKKMTFNVKNASVKKSWNISGTSASQESSFSTKDWKPGIYYYAFLVEDDSGNSQEYTGSFILDEKKLPEIDTTKPTGTISRISRTYTEGDKIYYTIQARDDKSLSKMTFDVKNASVKKSWNISGTSASQKSSFSTRGWRAGTYKYSLLVEDSAGNSREYTESFALAEKEPPDPPPTGEITGIRSRYTVGETISYTVRAKDNKLKGISFRVKNSSVKKAWDIRGKTSADYDSSFPTSNWISGKYDYSLSVKDIAGNSREYLGSFILEPGDTILPRGSITILSSGKTAGDTINYIVHAEDNHSLKKMSFKVGNRTLKTWDLSGKTTDDRNAFSTKGWKNGKYDYSLMIEDVFGNSQKYTGDFILAKKEKVSVSEKKPSVREEKEEKDKKGILDKIFKDTSQPKGRITGIKSSYVIGDTINYTAEASDNKSLRSMVFKIGSRTWKTWNVSGRNAVKKSSFPTQKWQAGKYYYALFTEDSAGNSDEYKGSFVLEEDKSDMISKRFEELRRLKHLFSESYGTYKQYKEQEKQGINVKSRLSSVVREIIGILKKMENLYQQFPQTPEIKQGIRDTKNALKEMEKELFLLTG